MKVVLVHGDDVNKSRKRLLAIVENVKKREWEVNRFSEINKESFLNKFTSGSLFAKNTLYVVENATKISAKDLQWIKKKGEVFPGSLLLYMKSQAPARFVKSLPRGTKFEEFTLPKVIFNMLDSIIPGNSKTFNNLFYELVRRDGQEFVLAVLARYLRDLYWVSSDAVGLGYPSWRVNKLKRQSERLTAERIKAMIDKLSRVDILSKLGKEDLVSGIDLVITRELR